MCSKTPLAILQLPKPFTQLFCFNRECILFKVLTFSRPQFQGTLFYLNTQFSTNNISLVNNSFNNKRTDTSLLCFFALVRIIIIVCIYNVPVQRKIIEHRFR